MLIIKKWHKSISFIFAMVVVSMLLGCNRHVGSNDYFEDSAVDAKDQAPIVSVYLEWSRGNRFNRGEEDLQILVMIWADGSIVWSKNQKYGGEPYYINRLTKQKLNELMEKLDAENISSQVRSESYLILDSSYMTIDFNLKRDKFRLESGHELWRENSNLVFTHDGVGVLGDRSREEVMAEQPKEFLKFLKVWDDIRETIGSYVPEDGEPVKMKRNGYYSFVVE